MRRDYGDKLPASLVLFLAMIGWLGALSAAPRGQDDGRDVYTEAGCARCHSVEAAGLEATGSERMRGPDLTTVGASHDEAWVIGVMRQEIELGDGPHRVSFRGTDEELATIAAWLVQLDAR